jgi:hypothetical protein
VLKTGYNRSCDLARTGGGRHLMTLPPTASLAPGCRNLHRLLLVESPCWERSRPCRRRGHLRCSLAPGRACRSVCRGRRRRHRRRRRPLFHIRRCVCCRSRCRRCRRWRYITASGRDGEAGAAGQLDRAAARAAPRAGAGVLAVTATRSVDVDDAIDLAFAADLYDRKFCLSEKQSKNIQNLQKRVYF